LKTALRAAAIPVKAAVAGVMLLDAAARPFYRPVVDGIFRMPFFAKLEDTVSGLPRWAILVLFSVPFIVAEPLKLVALLLLAKGKLIGGVAVFLVAQLLTFVLVERIYHAGREKLLTYGWLAWIVARLSDIRAAIDPFRVRMARRVRAILRLHKIA
jgi:hypothetical protein